MIARVCRRSPISRIQYRYARPGELWLWILLLAIPIVISRRGWCQAGLRDPAFGAERLIRYPVSSILITPQERILVGGSFRKADGSDKNYLAQFNLDGSL